MLVGGRGGVVFGRGDGAERLVAWLRMARDTGRSKRERDWRDIHLHAGAGAIMERA